MLLNELIQTTIKNRDVEDHDYSALKNQQQDNSDKAGREKGFGAYGRVVPNKADPHMVKKNNYAPVSNAEMNDGYFAYIKAVVDSKAADSNPAFPRVYDIKTFTDRYGDQRYRINLEKLLHFDELSGKEVYALGERLFNNWDVEYSRAVDNDTLDTSTEEVQHLFTEMLSDPSNIKDENVKNALQFIHNLAKKKKLQIDIQGDNFMFRRTKYGLQLVLVDPITN